MHWFYWFEGGLVIALLLLIGWMLLREKRRK